MLPDYAHAWYHTSRHNTILSSTFPVRVSDHEVREHMATYDSLCFLRERHPARPEALSF